MLVLARLVCTFLNNVRTSERAGEKERERTQKKKKKKQQPSNALTIHMHSIRNSGMEAADTDSMLLAQYRKLKFGVGT